MTLLSISTMHSRHHLIIVSSINFSLHSQCFVIIAVTKLRSYNNTSGDKKIGELPNNNY